MVGVGRVTYASRPWGCEGLWVEETHAVTEALVLHSAEALLRPIGPMIWVQQNLCENMRGGGEDLKVNWSARGGETAGEVEGGGGEERGELLWVACNNISFFVTFFIGFCVFKAFNLEEKAAESLSIRLSD